jgi:hypothetical protein
MTTPAGWYPATDQPGTERYWDGTVWTDQTRQPVKPSRSTWYRSRWLHLAGALVLGLILGGAIGGSGAASADKRAAAAASKMKAAQASETQALQDKSAAELAAQTAQETADGKVAAQIAALDARSQALDQREAKIGALEHQAAANFPNGTYLVGTEIKPGTYKSSGPDGSNGAGCYWARHSKNNDLLDNNVSQGPSIVVVHASDFSIEFAGCEPYKKVG